MLNRGKILRHRRAVPTNLSLTLCNETVFICPFPSLHRVVCKSIGAVNMLRLLTIPIFTGKGNDLQCDQGDVTCSMSKDCESLKIETSIPSKCGGLDTTCLDIEPSTRTSSSGILKM